MRSRGTSEINRYRFFVDAMTTMVVHTYRGSLKAEHGTGRNMAPFVEKEWGAEAYALMKRIKEIFDPLGLLNPDVVLSSDPGVHLKNLKPLPIAHDIVDKCIECGFCESHCPSKDLTVTPRQRIALFREFSRMQALGAPKKQLRRLRSGWRYSGMDTCATDGLCATACPVGIDTGKLIKHLRGAETPGYGNRVASIIAAHMHGVTRGMRLLLNVLHAMHRLLGSWLLGTLSGFGRLVTASRLPAWNPEMPRGADLISQRAVYRTGEQQRVVYFPSCINRTMGRSRGDGDSLTGTTCRLLRKAGFEILFPENLDSLCCGMPFESKGYAEQGQTKARELGQALLKASNGGSIPIYVDMSPCLLRMKETLPSELKLYEPVDFILEFLPDKLDFRKIDETVAIHTTCSSIKMGLGARFTCLAQMCAKTVIVPDGIECCGWAGDRGFTFPELNASALASLRAALPDNCAGGYSTSRTCEIGLSLHSGIPYSSIVYLVDRATTAREIP